MENMATLQECIPLNWQYEPQREWLCVSVTWRNEKPGQRLALQQTTPGVRPQVHNEHSRCYTAPAPHVFIIHSRLLWLKFPHKLFSVLFQTISPLILNLTEQKKKRQLPFTAPLILCILSKILNPLCTQPNHISLNDVPGWWRFQTNKMRSMFHWNGNLTNPSTHHSSQVILAQV